MKLLQKLFVVCGLLGFTIFKSLPAQALSDNTCLADTVSPAIKPDVILECLRTGQSVYFDGVTIMGDLDLTALRDDTQQSMVIPNRIEIVNSRFTGSLISYDGDNDIVLIFKEQVDLRGSQFDGSVDFTGATFEQFAHFENTRFDSQANFTQTTFHNGASFINAQFNDSSFFTSAQISGGIDFSGSQFFTLTDFSYLHSFQSADPLLQSDIFFSGAQFTGEVLFMDAVFENQAFFRNTIFKRISPQNSIHFTNTTFTTLDLSDATFETEQLEINDLRYEKLIMPNFHPSILFPQNTAGSLSALKDNFREQGRLDLANEIAYWQNGVQHNGKPVWVQVLETIFLDWTFGYGYKPLRSIVSSVVLVLFFAVFYFPTGTLRPAPLAPSKPREQKWTLRLAEIPIAHDDEYSDLPKQNRTTIKIPWQVTNAWQAILFSIGVFTKISSGKYIAVRVRSLVVIEWGVGLIMMAGFLFSLANTNPLIRSLVDVIF